MSKTILKDRKTEKFIEELLLQLTLDEKIAIVHAAGYFKSGEVERLDIPPVVCSDGPMGVREEFLNDRWIECGHNADIVTYNPCNSALASTWNKELSYQLGRVLGDEARGRGKDVILAPGVNIKRSPLCGRNFEYMSEDTYLTKEMAVPFIRGVQENDVAACIKHFACNVQETDRLMVDTIVDERTLFEIYLPAFKAALLEGDCYSIMAAYNKLNGYHCCENKWLLNEVIRKRWEYDGAVISDWGGIHNTLPTAESGMDLEMSVYPDFDEYYFGNPLKEAVISGEVDESVVDEKVKNLLRLMIRLNMLGKNRDERKSGAFNVSWHRDTAREVAEESIILLKNENNTLPIKKSEVKKILVVGKNAEKIHSDGGGSAEIKALYEICPLLGIKMFLGGNVQVDYVPGYYVPENPKTFTHSWQETSLKELEDTNLGMMDRDSEDDSDNEAILQARFEKQQEEDRAKKAEEDRIVHEKNLIYFDEALNTLRKGQYDKVIFVGGLNHDIDTEGSDRRDMKLPYEQDALIEALLNEREDVILTFVGGSSVEMPWKDRAKSILWCYYAGMETGIAFANVLFGKVNPSGKLAETFADKYEDTAIAQNGEFGKRGRITLKEGLFFGYRHHDKTAIKPAFCFGHGLSYTSFAYEELKLKINEKKFEVTVSFTIKNTGSVDGMEIAQVYVMPKSPSVVRPVKELKGFVKEFIPAGKSKRVSVTLSKRDFSYYNVDSHDFVADPGTYGIYVGASCEDLRLCEDALLGNS